MKANKVLKRLAKIEELMSDVMERYSESAPHIRAVLQDAKAAVTRAKEAVSLQSSSSKKNPPLKHSGTPSKADTKSAQKKAATKKAAVKVPPAKAAIMTAPAAQATTKAAAR
jgi:hypothetical protein